MALGDAMMRGGILEKELAEKEKKMKRDLLKEIGSIELTLGITLRKARNILVGREVRLRGCTRHGGRTGKITDTMTDHSGEILALVYVYKIGAEGEFLNGRPWSRQYRPLSDLEILE